MFTPSSERTKTKPQKTQRKTHDDKKVKQSTKKRAKQKLSNENCESVYQQDTSNIKKKNNRRAEKNESSPASHYQRRDDGATSVMSSRSGTSVTTARHQVTDPASNKDSKEKWTSEDVARSYIEKIDPNGVKKEFYDLITMPVNIELKCTIWKKNMSKNQGDGYPCFDSNIIKNSSAPNEYVNASIVTVPHVSKNMIMAQMPVKSSVENIEEFWKAMFQESVMLMHILIGADEVIDFFPLGVNQYEHFGSMFVNNRKVEKADNDSCVYLIEILPTGFSNSNMCKIVVHNDWDPHNVPLKFGSTLKSVMDVITFGQTSLPDEKCAILSKHGAGRAGFFTCLVSSLSALNNKIEPKVYEIVRSVREQRPLTVESLKQYTSLYLCLNYYIKKKVSDARINSRCKKIQDAFREMLTGASIMQ